MFEDLIDDVIHPIDNPRLRPLDLDALGRLGRSSLDVGGRRWAVTRRGLLPRTTAAVDPDGVEVGEFTPHLLRGGGDVRWAGRRLAVRRSGRWRERYDLVEAGVVVARIGVRGLVRYRLRVEVDERWQLDVPLVLFAGMLAREDAVRRPSSWITGNSPGPPSSGYPGP